MDTRPISTLFERYVMSQYALRIPDSLMETARDYAKKDNTSMNQFFVIAISEKIAALKTEQFFKEKSALANEKSYLNVLAKVKDNPVIKGDEVYMKSDK